MKTNFIALSPYGLIVFFIAGIMAGWTLAHPDFTGFIMIVVSLIVAREDAVTMLATGSYSRRRLVWRRTGALNSDSELPQVVS